MGGNKIEPGLALCRKEERYLDSVLRNIPRSVDRFEIEKLLFEIGDASVVTAIVMIYICSNSGRDYSKYLNFLAEAKIPEFTLSGEDLKKCGFENRREYGRLICQAKDIFRESRFKLGKEEVMKILRTRA